MYKFVKAYESYDLAKYPIQEFYAPEYEILTPEVEEKIVEYLTHYYVNRWGKTLEIKETEGLAEMNIQPAKYFMLNGVLVKYEKVSEKSC